LLRYLIKELKISRDEALRMIQNKRPLVLPNMSNFKIILNDFNTGLYEKIS